MHRSNLGAAIALLSAATLSFAGPQHKERRMSGSDYISSQTLLDQYASGKVAPSRSSEIIEAIQTKGLKPTSTNVGTVLRLLARAQDQASKADLLRLLGSLYTNNDESGRNISIARTLKGFIYSGDRRLALVAIQTYVRIDYQPDRTEILDYGLRSGILDENSYCQELALFIPLEPPLAQYAGAKRLIAKNNRFGAEVLALTIGDAEVIKKISPEAQKLLLEFLEKNEPRMPAAMGEYGVNDGGRYADWLDTIALLSEALGKASYADAVLTHLDDERVDPRKILGYMTSADGKRFMKRIGHKAAFAQAAARATLLASQFPDHPVFVPFARDVELTIGSLPE